MKSLSTRDSMIMLVCLSVLIYAQTLIASTGTAPLQPLQFESGSWDEIRKIAKNEGKPIFAKVVADYCMPCKMMEENVFTDREVITFFSQNFVNYKVDVQTFDGSIFQLAYGINTIPDLLFFSPDGTIAYRDKGAKSKDDLLELAQAALHTMNYDPLTGTAAPDLVASNVGIDWSVDYLIDDKDPHPVVSAFHETETPGRDLSAASFHANRPQKQINMDLEEMHDFYGQGYEKVIFLFDYAYELRATGEDASEVSAKYLSAKEVQKNKQLDTKTIRFIYDFVETVNHPAFSLLVKNKAHAQEILGVTEVQARLRNAIENSTRDAASKKNKKLLKKSLKAVSKAQLGNPLYTTSSLKTTYYERTRNWKSFAKEINKYIKKTKHPKAITLNNASLTIYKNSNNEKLLKMAMDWIDLSTSLEPAQYNYDTKARILLKLGQKEQAIKEAERAIYYGKKNGNRFESSAQLLENLKKE